ncbi:SURF1 family protein [Vibrio gallicus]|uniref:SURF1 family protein n=1 Tax=Vibrio gallicus TaxID=190897 RepID=UPI0021C2C8E0|nr:SURF1 family protein [Vibrio gallicus]
MLLKTILLTLTVAVFVALVKLGFWQLARGDEKLGYEADLMAREDMAPLNYTQIMNQPANQLLTGFPVRVVLDSTDLPLVYWDNVTSDSGVGYRVFQIMQLANNGSYMLVELGFVQGGVSRERLPVVNQTLKNQVIEGRVFEKSLNPLSSDLLIEPLVRGVRIQNLNLEQLGSYFERVFVPFIVQPSVSVDNPLPKIWKPYPMTSQKHYGYAFQWFAMAGVYALLIGLIVVRRKKNGS